MQGRKTEKSSHSLLRYKGKSKWYENFFTATINTFFSINNQPKILN